MTGGARCACISGSIIGQVVGCGGVPGLSPAYGVVQGLLTMFRQAFPHVRLPAASGSRRVDFLCGGVGAAWQRFIGARDRGLARSGAGNAGGATVSDRRMGGVAGPSALRLDTAAEG